MQKRTASWSPSRRPITKNGIGSNMPRRTASNNLPIVLGKSFHAFTSVFMSKGNFAIWKRITWKRKKCWRTPELRLKDSRKLYYGHHVWPDKGLDRLSR